jgi:hypothetical protein
MSRNKHQGRRVPTPDEVAESVRLAHIARERHQQGVPTDEDGRDNRPVSVQGIFGHYSRKPLVEFTLGDDRATWSPGRARQFGLWLIEAADAAATDGFLVSFFSQRNYSEEDIAKILYLFRQHRAEERQEAERAAALAQLDQAEQQATEAFLRAFLADVDIDAAVIEGFVQDWRTHRAMQRVDSA